MAMANNWMSFSFPPVLWPCIHDHSINDPLPLAAAITYDDNGEPYTYSYQFFPQPSGGGEPSAPPLDPLESSSLSSSLHQELLAIANPATPEDAASAIGSGSGQSPEAASEFALSLVQTPPPPPAQSPAGAVAQKTTTGEIVSGSGQRTSIYRGVTRHRWTGRYEAHLWDNSCWREGQKRKGRQVYLGGYDNEEKAARAYDLAALKYWGLSATTNNPASIYSKEMEEMKYKSKPEYIASLRRKSSGFSRGASIYRGVTRHHQQGRWQARIGRVAGNKDLYLGTFATEEEAAEAYDVAAIKFRGPNAVTNFEHSRYDVEAIARTELPIGASAKRIKQSLQASSNSQVTIANTAVSQNHNAVSSSLHNLLQLYPADNIASYPPYMGVIESAPDLCSQKQHWLTAIGQHDDQNVKNGENDPFLTYLCLLSS